MNVPLDLKNLERKAWSSYFQDGLLDIELGMLLFALALIIPIMERMDTRWPGYLLFLMLFIPWLLFLAGRRFITMPRLGWVKFGGERRKKKARLMLVMSAFLLLNILLLLFTVIANEDPDTW